MIKLHLCPPNRERISVPMEALDDIEKLRNVCWQMWRFQIDDRSDYSDEMGMGQYYQGTIGKYDIARHSFAYLGLRPHVDF